MTSIKAITQRWEVGRGEVAAGAAGGGSLVICFFSVRIGEGLLTGLYVWTGAFAFAFACFSLREPARAA